LSNNFRILVHRTANSVHLKLMGDFDGSSAYELLNVMKSKSRGTSKIFIHTSCLTHIHPFGRSVFQNDPDITHMKFTSLIFTGENAAELAPDGSKLY
jgi:hypothetical protein